MNKHAAITAAQFATVEAKALRQALKPIRFVVEKRNTMPILGHVVLSFSGSTLTLRGTDLDIDISATLDAIDGDGEWAIAVDVGTFERVCSVHGTAAMRMEFIGPDMLRIEVGDATYSLCGLSAEGMPEIKGKRGKKIETFSNGQLGQIFDMLRPAVSEEETRYYLNGVYWHDNGKKRRFVATNGHMLIGQEYAPGEGEGDGRIVPKKVVDLIRLQFKGADVTIFEVGDSKIDVTCGEFSFRAKLIEGTYPDVDRVIPKLVDEAFKISFNRSEILQAFRSATAIPSFRLAYGRALRFFPSDDGKRLRVESKSADIGVACIDTQSEWPRGMSEFGFNSQYITRLISGCTGNVTLHQKDSHAPGRFVDDDDSMVRVLMPMRI